MFLDINIATISVDIKPLVVVRKLLPAELKARRGVATHGPDLKSGTRGLIPVAQPIIAIHDHHERTYCEWFLAADPDVATIYERAVGIALRRSETCPIAS